MGILSHGHHYKCQHHICNAKKTKTIYFFQSLFFEAFLWYLRELEGSREPQLRGKTGDVAEMHVLCWTLFTYVKGVLWCRLLLIDFLNKLPLAFLCPCQPTGWFALLFFIQPNKNVWNDCLNTWDEEQMLDLLSPLGILVDYLYEQNCKFLRKFTRNEGSC